MTCGEVCPRHWCPTVATCTFGAAAYGARVAKSAHARIDRCSVGEVDHDAKGFEENHFVRVGIDPVKVMVSGVCLQ